MPTSEARIQANRMNAAQSTGPKTEEGKARSRQNSLKHGLTGEGIVLAEVDAAEVELRSIQIASELRAAGSIGQALARRAAVNSVRMERAADQQTAALAERCRKVAAEFVPPEGVDDAQAEKLRSEAVRIAMFDPSKEANRARQYEAAAERNFYKAMNALRQAQRQNQEPPRTSQDDEADAALASILATRKAARELDIELDSRFPIRSNPTTPKPANSPQIPMAADVFHVPITIGRPR